MKRILLMGVIMLWFSLLVEGQGQWSGTTPGDIYYNQGNVSIGTSTPSSYKLNVIGNTALQGTTNANVIKAINSAHSSGANAYNIELYSDDTGDASKYVSLRFHQGNQYWSQIRCNGSGFRLTSGASDDLVPLTLRNLYTSGDVGIGTLTPQAKLDVLGDIRAFSSTGSSYITSRTSAGGESQVNIFTDAGTSNRKYWRIGKTYSQEYLAVQLLNDDLNSVIQTPMVWKYDGSIGIGTTNPVAKLHIENGENTDATILATSSENNKLVVSSGSTQPVYCSTFKITQQFNDNRNNGFISFNRGLNASGGFLTFGTNGLESVRFDTNGNVLIGKTTQTNSTYKLDVLGKIRADEVVVNTTGADFVFSPEYNLPNLSEIEKYIKENSHLPDIASAAEMQEKGMNVSEMQTKLLQKIEELTLYVIEQKKEIEALKQDIINHIN